MPSTTQQDPTADQPIHQPCRDPSVLPAPSGGLRRPTAGSGSSAATRGTRPTSTFKRLRGFLSPNKLSPSSPAAKRDGINVSNPESPSPPPPSSTAGIGTVSAGTTAAPPHRSSAVLEKVFGFFDGDGDGKISPSELRRCMGTVGQELSPEEAAAAVESTDSDGDGLLGFEDFVKLVEAGGEEERTRDLREAFGVYEMKGRGCITPESLRRMLRRLGEEKTIGECKAMIGCFDVDGDGVLSFDEFKLMMLQ